MLFNLSKPDLLAVEEDWRASNHTPSEIEMSLFENSPLYATLEPSAPPPQYSTLELPNGRSGSVRRPRSPVVRPRFMSVQSDNY